MSDGIPTKFKEKLDMSQIVFRQIDRGNMIASIDQRTSTFQKKINLPLAAKEWVMDQADRFEEPLEILVFKSAGPGVTLGYENDPIVWNDDHSDMGLSSEQGFTVNHKEDGEVDWNDKRIVSPYLKKETRINYDEFDEIIMEAYEHNGLTWNLDTELVKVDTIVPAMSDKKTPLLKKDMPGYVKEEEKEPEL